ncbi:MAG: hypothetical protein UW28_C0038G0012 [Parcubacteria group bacterium GW2011_GWA2_44_13]|nr:MAG: hypothetical protein UW28_C0038G0012 [Parcubacteria group bacterium GW2011_GWA2_44_13]
MENFNQQPANYDKNKLIWWVIIILVVLLTAAFVVFFWRSIPYSSVVDFSVFKKDSISAIERDLNAVEMDNLDSELADIEKEINQ